MDISKIKDAATEFRNAIEICSDELGISFENFPRGSCGDTCDLLGTYLIEKGVGYFNYVSGEFGSKANNTWSSHAWLQSGKLVVDITADQFPNIDKRVIVSSCSEWHKSLNGQVSHLADYRKVNTSYINLDAIYKKIMDYVNAI